MRMRFLAMLLGACAAAAPAMAAQASQRPNFLVIVADDLGFSDIGAFGGEIATPNLDRIAANGVRFTGFHTAPTCSPTRSMLLTGTDNHRAGLGTMAELIAPNQRGHEAHLGYLRPETATIGEIFAANGYRTLYSGKWHLGLQPQQDPHARGFQHSFALLQGGHDHFGGGMGNIPQAQATYTVNGQKLPAAPANFYSSDYFSDTLARYIRETKQTEGDKPFLAFLTFTAPHWPLQAPAETIAKYKGRYDAGYEALRDARVKRQGELGLIDPSKQTHPSVRAKRWADLSEAERRQSAHDMEIYAAMVDRLDQGVGRVLAALEETGELDNTVILFLADNGAEGMDITANETAGIGTLAKLADQRPERRGQAGSFVAYGPGWAQASVGQPWLFKAYATEGGTRVVSFLGGKPVGARRGVASTYLSVADVVPTFLDIAGIKDPKGNFAGRQVEPIRGHSWLPWLNGKAERGYAEKEAIGTELFGSRALREGDWKITDIGDGQWRLFNLASDPGETTDLSPRDPARFTRLKAAWDAYAKEVGVILPDEQLYKP